MSTPGGRAELTAEGRAHRAASAEQAAASAMLAQLKAPQAECYETKLVTHESGARPDEIAKPTAAANDAGSMLPPRTGTGAPAACVAAGQRCGLIAIVGKPNVGKSTLMNALVGQKISITSRKAQTTPPPHHRHRTPDATQFVFVDTPPGFQTRHSTALNKSLNKTVMGAIGDVDLILFVVEAGSFTWPTPRCLSAVANPASRRCSLPTSSTPCTAAPRSRPGSRACRSATRSPSSCPCRPRTQGTSSACYGICENTCPSRPGGTARTS